MGGELKFCCYPGSLPKTLGGRGPCLWSETLELVVVVVCVDALLYRLAACRCGLVQRHGWHSMGSPGELGGARGRARSWLRGMVTWWCTLGGTRGLGPKTWILLGTSS